MHPFRFTVSLRVRHPDADPPSISDAVGLEPKWSWKAGEQRRTPAGTLLEGTYTHSYCCYDLSSGDDGKLAKAVADALARLGARAAGLQVLRSTGGEFEFFVGWFTDRNTGEVFTPELLGRLAHLGIALSLDVYGGPE